MRWFRRTACRVRALFRKETLDAEMAEEMRAHLELQIAQNIAQGMSPDDARHAAQRQFGGVEQIKEIARDQRGGIWLEQFLRDLRHGFRSLAKSPGFTAVAVLSLALSIGVNSAVFALFNAIVLRPVVPLRPDEVVNLFNGRRAADRDFRPFSYDEYLTLREARDTFAEVAATQITVAGIAGTEGMRRSRAYFTSENYFSMLGVQPIFGRFFNADECRPNANIPVVVTSHALWQREGGQSDFVGRTLRINGKPYTVIGVAPEDFKDRSAFMAGDLWAPLGVISSFSTGSGGDLAQPKTYLLNLTVRLAPGITLESLSSRLAPLGERLTALQPDGGAREIHAEVPSRMNVSSAPSGDDPAMPVSMGFFSMSGCVLLIACLNLANMLLARGSSREKEIALRLALGADRWRVVRQLLVEGLVLACLGGVLGLLIGMWGNSLLLQSFAAIARQNGESLALEVQPDARVLGVTFLLCLVATLFFSLGPALKASRVDLLHALKLQSGGTSAAGRLHCFFSLRHCLVMGQIALSLMLLFSAALFLRGAIKAGNVAPGFDPSGTLAADVDYSLANLRRDEAQQSLFSTLDHIAAQPGVRFTAAATFIPYSSRSNGRNVRPSQPAPSAPGSTQPVTVHSSTPLYTAITPGYFDAVGVRLVRGRDFTVVEARDPAAPPVAIIDELLAKKLFPTGDALGERIRIGSVDAEVVGICAPHRHNNRRPEVRDRVFVPYVGGHDGRAFILIRYATNDPASTAAAIAPLRTALRAFNPDLPLLQITTLSRLVEQDSSVWLARIGAIFFGLFGAIALGLAVVGVYGVKAYAVARRTREIGIRIAIGAQPRDVFRLLLKQGALQVMVGVAGGLLLALGAGKILAKMVYQVSPADPLALGVSAVLLGATALLACFVPARRATRVNPIEALRTE